MTAFYAILLGIIQGITEFLPVSSFGHSVLMENFMGSSGDTGMLFETMLHIGTLFAVFTVFQKDIQRIGEEFLGLLADLVGNLNLYFHNRRTGENLHYARIMSGSYRKFAVLVLLSMVPTASIGYACRRLAAKTTSSPLMTVIGLLITGIILLVTDLSKAGGTKTAREVSYDHAMWLGICQGLSVFPGFSRSGLTICMALLLGFSRTYAVKFSYIMSIPAVIGAFFLQAGAFTSSSMSVGLGFTYILGMLSAAVTGYFAAKYLLRIVHKGRLRYFAYYCFLAGALVLAGNYLI